MTKKKECQELLKREEKREIIWNLINSGLAGGLVLLGSFSTGEFSWRGFILAGVASLIVLLTKFKEYWDGEKGEYSYKLFKFL